MLKKQIYIQLTFLTTLFSEVIHLRSDFSIPAKLEAVYEKYTVLEIGNIDNYINNFTDSSDLKKIVMYGYAENWKHAASRLPKDKLICFVWEPRKPLPPWDIPYSRIYTWDDDSIDGVRYFKCYYPFLRSMDDDLPSFEEKKLCTMVVGHWTNERIPLVAFFGTKPEGDFEFYGGDWVLTILGNQPMYNRLYRGGIGGFHSGLEKQNTQKKYRFCICFENTVDLNGYITEKIWDCFAAGCVPIYWGAPNIEKYIPKTCFVDYRDFSSNEELYRYIKTMSKKTYEKYLDDIRNFLKSEKAQLFSPENFNRIFYDAISS